MKNTALLVVVAAVCLCLVCCKSEVESKSIVFSSEPPRAEELCLATMDALLLENPADDSQVITQVREGDHLDLLEVQEKWAKATHTPSGQTGWIHSGAWTMRKQSKFWSGDTVKAWTEVLDKAETTKVIEETHDAWKKLKSGETDAGKLWTGN